MDKFEDLKGVLGELRYVFGDNGPALSSSCNIPSEALRVLLNKIPALLVAYNIALDELNDFVEHDCQECGLVHWILRDE